MSCNKKDVEKIPFCGENYNKDEKVIFCLNKENINDFENITKFKNLRKLDLSHSKIKNILLLKELKNLEILYLYNSTFEVTEIKELSFVKQVYSSDYIRYLNCIELNNHYFHNPFMYIDEVLINQNNCNIHKQLRFFYNKKTKILKLRLNNDKIWKELLKFIYLEELWLNFDKYTKINYDYLPKTLKRLVFVESEINNFDFVKDFYNLEEILIVNKDFTKEKISKIKNVTIKYVDPFIYLPTRIEFKDYWLIDRDEDEAAEDLLNFYFNYNLEGIKEFFDITSIKDIYIRTYDLIDIVARYLARTELFIDFIETCSYDYIKRMLDTKDIDINYVDKLNNTVLDYSYRYCNEKISNLLKEYKAKRDCELKNEKCD